MAALVRSDDSSVQTARTGRPYRVERLFTVRCGALLSLRLGAAALGVLVPAFRVGEAAFLLTGPTLMAAFGLDSLPHNRVVLCADEGVAPPLGRAKDLY